MSKPKVITEIRYEFDGYGTIVLKDSQADKSFKDVTIRMPKTPDFQSRLKAVRDWADDEITRIQTGEGYTQYTT